MPEKVRSLETCSIWIRKWIYGQVQEYGVSKKYYFDWIAFDPDSMKKGAEVVYIRVTLIE